MNAYRHSPKGIIGYMDMIVISEERLTLYKILDEVKLENFEIGSEKWCEYLKLKLKERGLKTYSDLLNAEKTPTMEKSQERDNVAHWFLGLRYCSTEELQNFYINWELQWFHLLYMNSTRQARLQFLRTNNFIFRKITPTELASHAQDLYSCFGYDVVTDAKTLYKTHWLDILEAVEIKKVFLHNGVAYFEPKYIVHCVKRRLKSEFLRCLEFQKKVSPTLKDNKDFCFVKDIPLVTPRKKNVVEGITLQNIDTIAGRHYPLCMRYIHDTLRLNHHLKYDSKMQYGVFLYHLGLPYEHALEFWQEEFTKKIDLALYKSKYEYLFKHQYGEVGRKREYPQSSCHDILNYSPLYQQNHGCPFKHWSSEKLREYLEQDCRRHDIEDIEELVQEGSYQRACTRYFCATKNVNNDIDVFDSPNGYVEASMAETAADFWDLNRLD